MEEGNALRDAYERPGFRPKRTPLGFLMFFRAEVGGSAAGCALHHRDLVALGSL